ncbi:MAG: hypothetical protein V4570_07825 [Pseudomonadota bacterium]
MSSEPLRNEIAKKYFVSNLPSASLVGSRLANILEHLEANKQLSSNSLDYLATNKLRALQELALGNVTFAEFSKIAKVEMLDRALELEVEKQRLETARRKEEEERDAASKIARKKIANDPRNIAKAKQIALRQKYGIECFIEQTQFAKFMEILKKIDAGNRLSEEQIIWLQTEVEEHYTPEIKHQYHKNEAKFYADEFTKTNDAWSAVNASSHYRKCDEAITAELLLSSIDVVSKDLNLKSALCTTHGGVKRDLMKWDDALSLGEKAHQITPKDFRPCTLLGAVYMEMGNYDLGQLWYEKAEQRGAEVKSIDSELRSIFFRADKIKQDALRTHLLRINAVRYSWTKK